MDWPLFTLGVLIIGGWFFYQVIKANFNDRVREANDELQDYYDSLSENNRIDDDLDDERVRHVQDKFND